MKHQQLALLVRSIYTNSSQDFGQWMWENHLQYVAGEAEALSKRFSADSDLAVAGAWLHDFGDAYVHRHASNHDEVSRAESRKLLAATGYSDAEIAEVLDVIIAPHSCQDGKLPTTLEGKVLATADALAHLVTDFYLQLSWKHIPEGKTYSEFVEWSENKIDRDFHKKIFFEEVKKEVEGRYLALKSVFSAQES
jgi:HD superfamily phosphodiesterase